MTKRLTTLFAAMAAGLLFSLTAAAQSVGPAVIILVDYQRVSNESDVGKDIAAQMESYRVDLENRRKSLQDELVAEGEEVEKIRNVVTPENFQERVRQFQEKQQGAQRELQEATQQSRLALQQGQLEVQRALKPIVKAIMTERNATLVLDKSFVSEHVSGLDVTTEVIERLNDAMPSYEVALPKSN